MYTSYQALGNMFLPISRLHAVLPLLLTPCSASCIMPFVKMLPEMCPPCWRFIALSSGNALQPSDSLDGSRILEPLPKLGFLPYLNLQGLSSFEWRFVRLAVAPVFTTSRQIGQTSAVAGGARPTQPDGLCRRQD
jgi:hypothetical protein